MARAAFVLNLDVEDELRLGDAHTTSRATRERIGSLASRLSDLTCDALLVDPWSPVPGSAIGLEGRAWCPTPRALRSLTIAGATLPDAPAIDVLRHVNHRRFAADLGRTLPDAWFVTTVDDACRQLMVPPSEGSMWLVKPALGFAGRGHLLVPPGPLDTRTLAAITQLIAVDGGVQIEPRVDRTHDFALHGSLSSRGDVVYGAPTVVDVDARGAWRATRRASTDDLDDDERVALHRAADRVASALVSAGYFGPFNIDAFRWRDRNNSRKFDARCEVNARFSMGWAIGMGKVDR